MKKELSAGFIVFYQSTLKLRRTGPSSSEIESSSRPRLTSPEDNKQREYLLLQYFKGYWDFAKGKIESKETELEAAVRELKEETNLEAKIVPGFKEKISYFFKSEDKELIHKTVTFFLAQALSKKVTISHEHLDYKWAPFEEAINILTYLNAQEVLTKAEEYINSGKKK